jgi:hypothetical protein
MSRPTLLTVLVVVTLLVTPTGVTAVDTSVDRAIDGPESDTRALADGVRSSATVTMRNASVVTTATETDLELQAARSGDSDEATLSYTFEVAGNSSQTTSVSVSPSSESFSGGDVTYEFVGWEDEDSGASGSGTSWTATGGHTYRVEYRVRATSGASEGTYDITAEAQTGNGNTYSSQLEATVAVLEPQFGSVGTPSADVVFDGDTGSETTVELDVAVSNTGDGVMVTDGASISGEPSGISASVDGLSNEISAGSDGSLDLSVTVQDSASEGPAQFDVTVTDTLGHTTQFTVDIEVTKVADVSADPETVDLGGVLVGQSATSTVTISEIAGYESVDNLQVSTTVERQGDLNVGDLEGLSVPAGGSEDAQLTATVYDDAGQGEDLDWGVRISGSEVESPTNSFTVTGTVWYPPYFDRVRIPSASLVFDSPATSTSEFTRTLDVRIRNGGDLPMQLSSISGTTDSGDVSVEVVDSPDTIPARSGRDATIRIVAQPTAPEGPVDVELTMRGTNPDTEADTTTATTTVTIDHPAELTLSRETVDLGQLATAQGVTESVTIGERLGYEDVQSFAIRREGPGGGWLTVTQQPASIAAGESERLIFDMEFNTSAEYYTTYTWTFLVSGENVQNREITVQATPVVPDTSSTVEQLGGFSGLSGPASEIPGTMQTALRQVEQNLLNNASDTPESDLRSVTVAGQTSVLFLRATQNASSAIESGNHSRAQQYVVRAAATYNTLQRYDDRIQNEELRAITSRAESAAEETLSNLIAEQTSYYQSQLENQNTTMLERANIKRELARLATLRGNEARGNRLREESQQSFQRYIDLVSAGNGHLQAARSQRAALDSSLFLRVFGQRVFWLGSLDRYRSATQNVLSNYRTAGEKFREAGATEQARSAARERRQLANAYDSAYTAGLVVAGVLGLLFLVVLGLEIRGIYRYIQDSEASVSGDFLV